MAFVTPAQSHRLPFLGGRRTQAKRTERQLWDVSVQEQTLKRKCCHVDDIFATGCTGSCPNDDIWTTSAAGSNENVHNITKFPFQWCCNLPFTSVFIELPRLINGATEMCNFGWKWRLNRYALFTLYSSEKPPFPSQWPWWRHPIETFSALLAICAGNSPVTGEFPAQRAVTQSFDVFFQLHLNKWLSKQSWGWWFETPWRQSWRHSNAPLKTCFA